VDDDNDDDAVADAELAKLFEPEQAKTEDQLVILSHSVSIPHLYTMKSHLYIRYIQGRYLISFNFFNLITLERLGNEQITPSIQYN